MNGLTILTMAEDIGEAIDKVINSSQEEGLFYSRYYAQTACALFEELKEELPSETMKKVDDLVKFSTSGGRFAYKYLFTGAQEKDHDANIFAFVAALTKRVTDKQIEKFINNMDTIPEAKRRKEIERLMQRKRVV